MQYEEFERRRKMRRRRRQQMMRRRCIFFTVLLLIIAAAVGAIYANIKAKPKPDENLPVSAPVDAADPSASPDASGEPAADETLALYPPAPEKPADILEAVKAADDGVKVAYLTFDDGPTTSVTPKILDTLRRYNVKATFFEVGSLIEQNPDMSRRVYDEGHLLANHSYAHNYSKLYASEEAFITEVQKTHELIQGITNDPDYPKVFRFPGGGYDAGSYGKKKQEYKKTLEQNGFRYCDWNALNGDAEGGSPSASQLVERVKSTAKRDHIVVLMHDAAAKKTTAEALPQIIEYLISQGYTFKTLDQA